MNPKFIAAFLGPRHGVTGITENGDVWNFTFPDAMVVDGKRVVQEPVWTLICRGPVESRS